MSWHHMHDQWGMHNVCEDSRQRCWHLTSTICTQSEQETMLERRSGAELHILKDMYEITLTPQLTASVLPEVPHRRSCFGICIVGHLDCTLAIPDLLTHHYAFLSAQAGLVVQSYIHMRSAYKLPSFNGRLGTRYGKATSRMFLKLILGCAGGVLDCRVARVQPTYVLMCRHPSLRWISMMLH